MWETPLPEAALDELSPIGPSTDVISAVTAAFNRFLALREMRETTPPPKAINNHVEAVDKAIRQLRETLDATPDEISAYASSVLPGGYIDYVRESVGRLIVLRNACWDAERRFEDALPAGASHGGERPKTAEMGLLSDIAEAVAPLVPGKQRQAEIAISVASHLGYPLNVDGKKANDLIRRFRQKSAKD